MKLSQLFYKCAYEIEYEHVGNSVNYAFEEDKDTLYIYFECSNSITDWILNFLFKKRPYHDMEIPYRVHRGFLKAWKKVEDIIIKKITKKELREPTKQEYDEGYIKVMDYKWKHIVVVGYSHGGALAGLCHECVWYHRPDIRDSGLEGYGFEAPRFYGGFHIKKSLKERWANFKVIRTNNDIVTHCPPWLLRFHHVGEIYKFKGDTKLVKNKLPKCIKSHYPEVVYDALLKVEESI